MNFWTFKLRTNTAEGLNKLQYLERQTTCSTDNPRLIYSKTLDIRGRNGGYLLLVTGKLCLNNIPARLIRIRLVIALSAVPRSPDPPC